MAQRNGPPSRRGALGLHHPGTPGQGPQRGRRPAGVRFLGVPGVGVRDTGQAQGAVEQVLLFHHAEQALGRPPAVRAEPFWTDCAPLARAGIPCLLFGADGEGAHAATGYVDLASPDRLAGILTATVADFCA
ncbi:hypothetical protein ACWDDN_37215 [Streptomyces griseoruber]